MKLTTHLCLFYLLFLGICAAVYALFGAEPLLFLCGGNLVVRRALLALSGVSALWLLYWFFAFRPTKYLS